MGVQQNEASNHTDSNNNNNIVELPVAIPKQQQQHQLMNTQPHNEQPGDVMTPFELSSLDDVMNSSSEFPQQEPPLHHSRFIPVRYQQQPFYYFLTTTSRHQHKQQDVQPPFFEQTGELLLLAVIIGLWLSAIAVFLHRWKSIRIVRAPETRMASYRPKNLEAIKIVAKHRDSVIYKNLPENMSRTLEARQKRLSRMSTVPNIKLGEQFQQLLPQPHPLIFPPLLLQPQVREQPVYCFGRPQSLPQLQEFLQQQLLQQLHLLRQTQHTNLLSPQPEEEDEQQEAAVVVVPLDKSSENVHIHQTEPLEQKASNCAEEQGLQLQTLENMNDHQPQINNSNRTSPQLHIASNNAFRDFETMNCSATRHKLLRGQRSLDDANYAFRREACSDSSQVTPENETRTGHSEDGRSNLPTEREFLLKSEAPKFQSKPKPILKYKTRLVLQPLLSPSERPLNSILK